jgi:uncharacterized membrane protein
MEIPREIYFIISGIVFTILTDLYLSSTSYRLVFLSVIRIIGIFIALLYRIIYDNYDKNVICDTAKTFWNPFKNTFVVIAAMQQAFVIYHLKFSSDHWSILYIVQQVSMPLFAYLWIRRIQNENLSFFQYVWMEIFGSKNDHGS